MQSKKYECEMVIEIRGENKWWPEWGDGGGVGGGGYDGKRQKNTLKEASNRIPIQYVPMCTIFYILL